MLSIKTFFVSGLVSLIICSVSGSAVIGMQKVGEPFHQVQQQFKAKYSCPMHPDVTSNKRGKCPDCGMALVKVRPPKSPLKEISSDPDQTFEKTVQGYRIQLQLHRNQLKMTNLADGSDASQGSTHTVTITVTKKKKKVTADAEVWFHITYPNKKDLMSRLELHEDAFSGSASLADKGIYTLMAHVNLDDVHLAATFKYEVK